MTYFSDKEQKPTARTKEDIPQNVWEGIVAHIESLISNSGFAKDFPSKDCNDDDSITGTNERSFISALKAEIPNTQENPLSTQTTETDICEIIHKAYKPNTLMIMDVIQFCYKYVVRPTRSEYHEFPNHHHIINFDSDTGKSEFREQINTIFQRNGLAYELNTSGEIKRLSLPVIGEKLESMNFDTSDDQLNTLLENARKKYFSPDLEINKESVKELWDAWERVKSLKNGDNKKQSTQDMLDNVATEEKFRELLDIEATALTTIGNNFHIRHSETTQTEISGKNHLKYLFHRLLSMIILVIDET